jgi:hypothetical protein
MVNLITPTANPIRRTWTNKLLIAEQWNARKIRMLKSGVGGPMGGLAGFYEGPYGVYRPPAGAEGVLLGGVGDGVLDGGMCAYYAAHGMGVVGPAESAIGPGNCGVQGGGVALAHQQPALPPLDLLLQPEPEEQMQRREENIRQSLLQYLHNSKEVCAYTYTYTYTFTYTHTNTNICTALQVDALLGWLRGCTSALRNSNPSIGEMR